MQDVNAWSEMMANRVLNVEDGRQQRQQTSEGDLTSSILPSAADNGSDASPLRRHNSLRRAIRRGDYLAYFTLIAMLIRGGVRSLLENVGASKTKCRILLLLSIIFETCATSLSKRARDIESPPLFVAACGLYLLWCVTLICEPPFYCFSSRGPLISCCFVFLSPLDPCKLQYARF
jgi:hypothetical protein